mgnify:CR=1 FL=1
MLDAIRKSIHIVVTNYNIHIYTSQKYAFMM